MSDIFILSGARTAIGTFGGSLAATAPIALGAEVSKAAIARAGVDAKQISDVAAMLLLAISLTPNRVTCIFHAPPRLRRVCPTRRRP